jgi:hypothetical protein
MLDYWYTWKSLKYGQDGLTDSEREGQGGANN